MEIKTSDEIFSEMLETKIILKSVRNKEWIAYKEVLDLPRTLLWDVLKDTDLPQRKKFTIQQELYKKLRNIKKEPLEIIK